MCKYMDVLRKLEMQYPSQVRASRLELFGSEYSIEFLGESQVRKLACHVETIIYKDDIDEICITEVK